MITEGVRDEGPEVRCQRFFFSDDVERTLAFLLKKT